ncbi:MAG TPA: signal peptidase I [Mycobacteriales bacterium]|nr:signal peptidase I [Mycobacteriales bacterium]
MRQGLRMSRWILLATLLAGAVMFWPQSLGGHVAYVRVDGTSMYPTLHNGDLAVVRKQSAYRIGDIVAYRIPHGEFGAGAIVIHRLIAGDGTSGYVTKGDNRTIKDDWHPRTADVVGLVRYDVPGAGNIVADLSNPMWLGGIVGGLTAVVMAVPSTPRRARRQPPQPRPSRHSGTPDLAGERRPEPNPERSPAFAGGDSRRHP